jgi:hypothetical protein
LTALSHFLLAVYAGFLCWLAAMHNFPFTAAAPSVPAESEGATASDREPEPSSVADKPEISVPDISAVLEELSVAADEIDAAGDEIYAVAEIAARAEEQTTEKSETRTLTREEEIDEALACPCIDSMRDGPCGDEFISAYRCFLESDSEPKGMDCVELFSSMQSCMAEHPEHYLDDEEEDGQAAVSADGESADGESAEAISVNPVDAAVDAIADVVAPDVTADEVMSGNIVGNAVETVDAAVPTADGVVEGIKTVEAAAMAAVVAAPSQIADSETSSGADEAREERTTEDVASTAADA